MASYSWDRFITRIPIQAEKEELYRAWSTRKGIEHWFLRSSGFRAPDGKLRGEDEPVQPGDTFLWQWHGWPDEIGENGRILDCNGTDQIRFTFGEAGNCAVTIKKEEGTSVVELEQTDIPTHEEGKHQWHLGCKTGWTFYLANLKSLMEGGIDLRNKNEALKNVVNS